MALTNKNPHLFNLEKSVGHRKDIQDIDVNSELINCVVTLRVMSKFFNLLGALRACVDFCDPTDFSRFNPYDVLIWLNENPKSL